MGIWIFAILLLCLEFNIFMIDLSNWQELTGSIIGALGGALSALYVLYKGDKDKLRDHLHLLHRSIGSALENLAETDKTLHDFYEGKLKKAIQNVDSDTTRGAPSIGYAFIPLMHVFELNEELLKRFSGSGYIDIKTIILINRSKDWRKIIDDLDRQLEHTFNLNAQIVLSGLSNPTTTNTAFKQNLENYKNHLVTDIFEKNIPQYAKELIQTQVALRHYIDWGPKKWKDTFKKVNTKNTTEEIDSYFKDEVNNRIDEVRPQFRSVIEKL